MKKLFVSMFIAGLTLLTGTACAQSESQNKAQSECCGAGSVSKSKAEKKGERKGEFKKSQREAYNPFEGVQLTEDQQQRLQVLRQGLGPVMPQSFENNDSVKKLTSEQKIQMRQERAAKKMEQKKNYLNGVKEILTPDQYIVFLENVYLFSEPQNQSGMAGKAKMKHDRKDKKDAKQMKKDGKKIKPEKK